MIHMIFLQDSATNKIQKWFPMQTAR